jgi:hypothetical protein
MQADSPLEFLARAQEDPNLSTRVLSAIERGNLVTAEEVLEIARDAGYSFSREDFEREVKGDMEKRFTEEGEGDVSGYMQLAIRADSPESSCAKGCLSWSINYCPSVLGMR